MPLRSALVSPWIGQTQPHNHIRFTARCRARRSDLKLPREGPTPRSPTTRARPTLYRTRQPTLTTKVRGPRDERSARKRRLAATQRKRLFTAARPKAPSHRRISALPDRRSQLRRLGRGKAATLDVEAVEQLGARYVEHARFEEAAALPLADRMLKSGDRAALSLGLAMRRSPYRANGYI